MNTITSQELASAVASGAAGIRCITQLTPLGGAGDKVFPPTYLVDKSTLKYALERRRINGRDVQVVLLNSVPACANHQELGLLGMIRDGRLSIPLTSVDFRDVKDLEGYGLLSTLEAPHRIFDALMRDSLDGDVLFRFGEVGRQITEATPNNATALFVHNPATLVYGGWDSTGPKGGLGAKYERCIVTEIVAIDAETGVKTSSRIDPVGIQTKAATLYQTPEGAQMKWTLDPAEARTTSKGEPMPMEGGDGAKGRPTQANHSNVPPSIDNTAGGITAESIQATTVLSFAALRKLRFPVDGQRTPERDVAARTTLAALGLLGVALSHEDGWDLRSRCALFAEDVPVFQLLGRPGSAPQQFTLDVDQAATLVEESAQSAAAAGLEWNVTEHLLRPTESLTDLIRRSQSVAADSPEGDED